MTNFYNIIAGGYILKTYHPRRDFDPAVFYIDNGGNVAGYNPSIGCFNWDHVENQEPTFNKHIRELIEEDKSIIEIYPRLQFDEALDKARQERTHD